ncbi:MAG: 3-phosphoshikimate 1-carboxyvinyltransferase [Myxococcaceae bacterium]|nr:3-phosphoshikimate 1-carboxyvinyltransferase [Myxococcaceae bacterium]MCI0671321.1 3-phosphoshikimate 1-carboxyvinyltransferase [Myxococcaceae bacterium]
MSTVVVDASGLHAAALTPPVSKSDAHRALVLGAMLGVEPRLGLGLGAHAVADAVPSDVRVLRDGLSALARAGDVEVDCADGGAPFRFLLTQAAIRPGQRTRFTGTPRLGERPHGPLLEALARTLGPAGFHAAHEQSPWPLLVVGAGRAPEPRFRIDGSASSQFASSLLLGAASLAIREQRAWTVELTGTPASEGYLALTEQWLSRSGFQLERHGRAITVMGCSPLPLPPVPGDWSSIGYLALVAWRSGGVVRGVDPAALHPDRALLRVLEQVGLAWEVSEGGLRVTGAPRGGLSASGADCPDLLPTLAALACVLPAPSTLTEVSILRSKESDRLEGIRTLVEAVGGRTTLADDTLTVHPAPRPVDAFHLDSRGDHRMAMSAATLAVLRGARLTLSGASCVEKSFPGFWTELARTGVRIKALFC